MTATYEYISSQNQLLDFYKKNKEISWMGLDTEFIGERRYKPLLCLAQVATEYGVYIFDTLVLNDLSPLLKLIEDEHILKLTHAGENDFQLFYRLFGIVPKNTFDSQVAAGFVGYRYPASFKDLLESELRITINKSSKVSDWKKRPISERQLNYAIDDVLHLKSLYDSLLQKLKERNRVHWLQEEMQMWEQKDYYADKFIENLKYNRQMYGLSLSQKLFTMRIHEWREKKAATQNCSKEMILGSKKIPNLIKMMAHGKKSLLSDRRFSDKLIEKHWEDFREMYQRPATENEELILAQIKKPSRLREKQTVLISLLQNLLKYQCIKEDVAPILLLSGQEYNRMSHFKDYMPDNLSSGWRKELLGDTIKDWLSNRNALDIEFTSDRIILKMKNRQ